MFTTITCPLLSSLRFWLLKPDRKCPKRFTLKMLRMFGVSFLFSGFLLLPHCIPLLLLDKTHWCSSAAGFNCKFFSNLVLNCIHYGGKNLMYLFNAQVELLAQLDTTEQPLAQDDFVFRYTINSNITLVFKKH